MDRNGSGTERRLRAMEVAFERERQQRDLLEKKYARLKRRYVRLERSHNRLLTESQGKRNDEVQTSPSQPETPRSVESTPNARMSTFGVIDLTSPRADFSSAIRNNSESLDNVSRSLRSGFLSRDDICAESPNSSMGSPELSTRASRNSDDQEEKEDTTDSWLHSTNRMYSSPASRRRLHLDFTLPASLTNSNRALSSPPRRMLHELRSDQSNSSHGSPQSAHSMTTHTGEPRTRTRPRLRLHPHSPERTAARAYGYELEQELDPRTHRHDRYRWVSDASPEPSLSPPMVSSSLLPANPSPFPSTNPSPLPPTISSPAPRPRAQSDEDASLALARYLQQQENIAAYEEYEARLLRESVEQEVYNQRSHLSSNTLLSGLTSHQHSIDPDNMTYEELLRLGDENGDVKKERWRQMAPQVLSSLPTHRWTRGHCEDTCIICQYNFVPNDRAMTLPCAHVFHEDCVGGWIRENNSCPLCKREITEM